MKSKIANFSAGPAAIPQEVLQEVKNELLNYKNIRKVTNNEIVIYDFETNTFSKKFDRIFL